jgi:hypothetical protein
MAKGLTKATRNAVATLRRGLPWLHHEAMAKLTEFLGAVTRGIRSNDAQARAAVSHTSMKAFCVALDIGPAQRLMQQEWRTPSRKP